LLMLMMMLLLLSREFLKFVGTFLGLASAGFRYFYPPPVGPQNKQYVFGF
jgi:hypothetical protein